MSLFNNKKDDKDEFWIEKLARNGRFGSLEAQYKFFDGNDTAEFPPLPGGKLDDVGKRIQKLLNNPTEQETKEAIAMLNSASNDHNQLIEDTLHNFIFIPHDTIPTDIREFDKSSMYLYCVYNSWKYKFMSAGYKNMNPMTCLLFYEYENDLSYPADHKPFIDQIDKKIGHDWECVEAYVQILTTMISCHDSCSMIQDLERKGLPLNTPEDDYMKQGGRYIRCENWTAGEKMKDHIRIKWSEQGSKKNGMIIVTDDRTEQKILVEIKDGKINRLLVSDTEAAYQNKMAVDITLRVDYKKAFEDAVEAGKKFYDTTGMLYVPRVNDQYNYYGKKEGNAHEKYDKMGEGGYNPTYESRIHHYVTNCAYKYYPKRENMPWFDLDTPSLSWLANMYLYPQAEFDTRIHNYEEAYDKYRVMVYCENRQIDHAYESFNRSMIPGTRQEFYEEGLRRWHEKTGEKWRIYNSIKTTSISPEGKGGYYINDCPKVCKEGWERTEKRRAMGQSVPITPLTPPDVAAKIRAAGTPQKTITFSSEDQKTLDRMNAAYKERKAAQAAASQAQPSQAQTVKTPLTEAQNAELQSIISQMKDLNKMQRQTAEMMKKLCDRARELGVDLSDDLMDKDDNDIKF